jgi:hypothetical protein
MRILRFAIAALLMAVSGGLTSNAFAQQTQSPQASQQNRPNILFIMVTISVGCSLASIIVA